MIRVAQSPTIPSHFRIVFRKPVDPARLYFSARLKKSIGTVPYGEDIHTHLALEVERWRNTWHFR